MNHENRFHNQIQFIDDLADLINHVLDRIAFSSEKTIASIVLLLSMVPEVVGVSASRGYAVGSVSAAVSLVTVKLALRDRGHVYRLPLLGKRRIYFGWPLYLLNLTAGLAFVYQSGDWVDLFLIAVSFCGAVSSEQIAQIIKAEMRERSKADLQAAKDQIRLSELSAKSEARTAAYVAKHAPAQADQTHVATDADTQKTVISADVAAEGRARGRKTQRTKVELRRDTLLEMLVERYPGVQLEDITYKEIGSMIGKSADTAKRDLLALQSAGRINGRVPEAESANGVAREGA